MDEYILLLLFLFFFFLIFFYYEKCDIYMSYCMLQIPQEEKVDSSLEEVHTSSYVAL